MRDFQRQFASEEACQEYDRQSSAMARRDPSWRQSCSAPGVPGRVRVSTQPPAETDCGLSDVAQSRCWPPTDAVSAHPRGPRRGRQWLIATYGGQLKQPDKQEMTRFELCAGRY